MRNNDLAVYFPLDKRNPFIYILIINVLSTCIVERRRYNRPPTSLGT